MLDQLTDKLKNKPWKVYGRTASGYSGGVEMSVDLFELHFNGATVHTFNDDEIDPVALDMLIMSLNAREAGL